MRSVQVGSDGKDVSGTTRTHSATWSSARPAARVYWATAQTRILNLLTNSGTWSGWATPRRIGIGGPDPGPLFPMPPEI